MIAIQQRPHQRTGQAPIMRLVVGLALSAALAYLLIGMDVLAVGDLQPSEGPLMITYVAAGCYLLGGLLILLRLRWLWIFGAVMNALVMLFFFTGYADRPSVLLSPGGLVTKAAQLLLEAGLLYLILAERRDGHRLAR